MADKKNKLVKCRYTHCKHPGEDLPMGQMVKSGKSSYYHPDCLDEKDTIAKIVDYYINNVDNRVTVAQLRSVINNIVFKKRVPAKELLFDLIYVHKSGRKINSPCTLHYIITNKKVQNEYKKYLDSKASTHKSTNVPVKEEVVFKSKENKTLGFDDIF